MVGLRCEVFGRPGKCLDSWRKEKWLALDEGSPNHPKALANQQNPPCRNITLTTKQTPEDGKDGELFF